MRLLVVTQYFWPENFRINDLVAELVRRGHQVTVLTGLPNYPDGKIFQNFCDSPGLFSYYEGAEIIRAPLMPRGNGELRLMLNYLTFAVSASVIGLWKLRGRKFDVIFAYEPSPITVGIPAVVMRAVKKAPLAFWVLDLWPETLQAIGVVRSKKILYLVGKLVRFIYSHCDLILAQSKSFIPAIARYARKDARIEYFPSWSDSVFHTEQVEMAIEIPLKEGSFNILFAGNIGEAQDFPAILAAAEILKTYSNIRWLIIGDGRMASWVAEEIKNRGLEGCVSLLGRYPVERMPSFFKHAEALLLPLKNEPVFALTIPGKLQSYLESGKPILAMLNGEGSRIVNESGSGFACSAGDARSLAELVLKLSAMSIGDREKMGRKGLEYSKREFGRSNLIAKLEQMLEHLNLSRPGK